METMSGSSSSTLAKCHGDGYLVSSEYPMLGPGDPPLSEADVRDGRIKGCNHIRCRNCGQVVKQIPHAIWKRPWPVGPTLQDAYVNDTIASLIERRPDLPHRIYACECKIESPFGASSLDVLWEISCHPWSCGGHESRYAETR